MSVLLKLGESTWFVARAKRTKSPCEIMQLIAQYGRNSEQNTNAEFVRKNFVVVAAAVRRVGRGAIAAVRGMFARRESKTQL